MGKRNMNMEMMTCPYNKLHMISCTKFQSHLIKCEKVYPPLAICPYNATHRMKETEMEAHVKICDSKLLKTNEFIPKVSSRIDPVILTKIEYDQNEYWE